MRNTAYLLLAFLCLATFSYAAEVDVIQQQKNTVVAGLSKKTAIESVQRAADENIKMLSETIRELKSKRINRNKIHEGSGLFISSLTPSKKCDDDDDDNDPIKCVSNCTGRFSDGRCYSYGSDICGPDASCIEKCTG